MEPKFKRYNNGSLSLARDKGPTGTFSQKLNPKSLEDLDVYQQAMHFDRLSIRQEDVEFAEQQGISLSMKVRIRLVSGVKVGDRAIIDGHLYNVSHIDPDDTDLYLYLEGVRQLDPR